MSAQRALGRRRRRRRAAGSPAPAPRPPRSDRPAARATRSRRSSSSASSRSSASTWLVEQRQRLERVVVRRQLHRAGKQSRSAAATPATQGKTARRASASSSSRRRRRPRTPRDRTSGAGRSPPQLGMATPHQRVQRRRVEAARQRPAVGIGDEGRASAPAGRGAGCTSTPQRKPSSAETSSGSSGAGTASSKACSVCRSRARRAAARRRAAAAMPRRDGAADAASAHDRIICVQRKSASLRSFGAEHGRRPDVRRPAEVLGPALGAHRPFARRAEEVALQLDGGEVLRALRAGARSRRSRRRCRRGAGRWRHAESRSAPASTAAIATSASRRCSAMRVTTRPNLPGRVSAWRACRLAGVTSALSMARSFAARSATKHSQAGRKTRRGGASLDLSPDGDYIVTSQ